MTTDAREKFFEMLRVVAENRYFKDVYAVEFFLSVFEMHRENAEGVITAENMTTAEKEMVRSHLPDFLHNTGICFRGIFSDTPRYINDEDPQMIRYILQRTPIRNGCIQTGGFACSSSVHQPIQANSFFKILFSLGMRNCCHSWYEKNLQSYETWKGGANSAVNGCRSFQIRNPSHALHKHPWWRGDFKFTQVIESNYELVD
ncbi:hypothetical protein PRIPAC_85121 [Pristionchus pacificus]|uniref:Uncharacterized protein n=1 Tax=Pristionchus pacificus TaxID=54126 RepID=A0A2A6BRV2_PRIPA|nr:hypothetical protein PRIPAC_85121 [Pristionchus pacificus]|eukprot:PDM68630.1 hypothetical protein PRIPAC_46932 [Pristionchus pacificus]